MAIKINETSTVKNSAEELIKNTTTTLKIKTSIDNILETLNQYWQLQQEDAQSFYKGLQKNSEYLENMVNCNRGFSDAIIIYIETNEKVSSRTV